MKRTVSSDGQAAPMSSGLIIFTKDTDEADLAIRSPLRLLPGSTIGNKSYLWNCS